MMLMATIVAELLFLALAGWGVHSGNTQMRDLATIAIAINSVLIIVAARQRRKKRSCCT